MLYNNNIYYYVLFIYITIIYIYKFRHGSNAKEIKAIAAGDAMGAGNGDGDDLLEGRRWRLVVMAAMVVGRHWAMICVRRWRHWVAMGDVRQRWPLAAMLSIGWRWWLVAMGGFQRCK